MFSEYSENGLTLSSANGKHFKPVKELELSISSPEKTGEQKRLLREPREIMKILERIHSSEW